MPGVGFFVPGRRRQGWFRLFSPALTVSPLYGGTRMSSPARRRVSTGFRFHPAASGQEASTGGFCIGGRIDLELRRRLAEASDPDPFEFHGGERAAVPGGMCARVSSGRGRTSRLCLIPNGAALFHGQEGPLKTFEFGHPHESGAQEFLEEDMLPPWGRRRRRSACGLCDTFAPWRFRERLKYSDPRVRG